MKKKWFLLFTLLFTVGLFSCQEVDKVNGEIVSKEVFESFLLNKPDNFTIESESTLKWFGENGNELSSSSGNQVEKRDGRKYSCINANQGTRSYGKTDGTYGVLDQTYYRELTLQLDEETDPYGYYHYVGYQRESNSGEWVLYGNRGSYVNLGIALGEKDKNYSNFKFENGWYVYAGETISFEGSGVDFQGFYTSIKYAFKDQKIWMIERSSETVYDFKSSIPDTKLKMTSRSVLSYGTTSLVLPEGLTFDPSVYKSA